MNVAWLKNQDGIVLAYKVLRPTKPFFPPPVHANPFLPRPPSPLPGPPSPQELALPKATSIEPTQFPRGSVDLHACRLFPTEKLCTSESIVRAANSRPRLPSDHHTSPTHPIYPSNILPPPRHCRPPFTQARSKRPRLPMLAPTPRPTLPSPTPSPATTTRAGRASRPRAATASRHMHRTAAHLHRTRIAHGHTRCARCIRCAPLPPVCPDPASARPPQSPPAACAQYMIYAKNVNNDGSVSDLLGFGFDKAAYTPPTLARLFSSPHARRTHAAHAARLAPPPIHKHTPPPPSPCQALNFAATSTMKYRVYLTCDGTTLTTGTMDLAVFSSANSVFSLSVQTDEVQVGYPALLLAPCLLSPHPTPHTNPWAETVGRMPRVPPFRLTTPFRYPCPLNTPSHRLATPSASATASPTTRRGSRSTAATACATRARSSARRCVGQGLQPPTAPFITLAPPYFALYPLTSVIPPLTPLCRPPPAATS